MIKVMQDEEFDSFDRTLICKCPKCGKDFAWQLNEDGVCPDNEKTRTFFDYYCREHSVTQCPECGHIFWDDDDCMENNE